MQIQCDQCEKIIEVPNPAIGQKVKCPLCGDINIIRADSATNPAPLAAPSAARDRAAAAGYPSALGPEVDVMVVRPAMFRASPLRFLSCALVIIAGVCGVIYFMIPATANQALAIACGAIAAITLIYLLVWKGRTMGEGLKITTKRTIDRRGFWSKNTSDVLHVDIKNIQISQSFLDRVWNVGMIALSSSAEHEEEIVIRNVPNPEHVREIIDLYRQL